jgi:hypothetical protein
MNDRDFAVVVGINRYQDSSFKDLDGPANDAEEFIDWLKRADGGNVPEANVDPFVLLSSSTRDAPTASDISTRLKAVFNRPRGRGEAVGRRLYVFLAGHGFAPAMTLSLLHSVETSRDVPAFVSGTQWIECFQSGAVFDELILLMDCCRDYEPNVDPPSRPCRVRFDAATRSVKQLYMLATGFGQGAYERKFNDRVHGLFSRALLDALKDDAIDGDGRMTAANVANAVRARLQPAATANLNFFPEPVVTQEFVLFDGLAPRSTRVAVTLTTPNMTLRMHPGDDVMLARPLTPVSVSGNVVMFDAPRGKIYTLLVTDSSGRLVRQHPLTVGTAPVTLEL